jgi:hypothetical protein
MALYELARTLNCSIKVVNGVPSALMYRFATWVNAGEPFEIATHVPGANGAAARGIVAQKADPNGLRAFATTTGYVNSQIAIPEGGQCLIELGEAVTDITVPLRVGGNSTEVDGAAYLANATGDVIVAYPLSLGSVGQIIPIQFIGYGGVVA